MRLKFYLSIMWVKLNPLKNRRAHMSTPKSVLQVISFSGVSRDSNPSVLVFLFLSLFVFQFLLKGDMHVSLSSHLTSRREHTTGDFSSWQVPPHLSRMAGNHLPLYLSPWEAISWERTKDTSLSCLEDAICFFPLYILSDQLVSSIHTRGLKP